MDAEVGESPSAADERLDELERRLDSTSPAPDGCLEDAILLLVTSLDSWLHRRQNRV